jgi:molybdopterin molybdotransferase
MAMALISVAEARKLLLSATTPLESETLPVAESLDRFLSAEVRAAGDFPPFSASAMDGYALVPGPAGQKLRLLGESRAGAPGEHELLRDGAIRISTGAAIPPGARAVIRQEDVDVDGDAIVLRSAVETGDNIRPAGEVMRAGEIVLPRGAKLGPAELAAAISAGAKQLEVGRRPRVAVLSTGDELRDPGAPLGPGEIHDSNGPMLAALCTRGGAVTAPPGRLPDDRTATEDGLYAALEQADVVIVAGGVSVGPHDHVKPALATLGVEQLLWGIALAPGKPTWLGRRGAQLVFGLPGNPVSAAVTFFLFVAPSLAAMQGAAEPLPPRWRARLGAEVRRNRSREQVLRVRLAGDAGHLVATPTGPQASHFITSLVGADAMAFIPTGEGVLAGGSEVEIECLPH